MTIADRLAQVDDAYQNAEAGNFGRSLPPDGLYQCSVDRFDFIEAKKGKNAGDLFLKTEMTVATGEQTGQCIELIHNLERRDTLGILKDHLAALEVRIDTLAVLETALPTVLDAIVVVKVWTTKKLDENGLPYRNAAVVQRVPGIGVSAATDTTIPF